MRGEIHISDEYIRGTWEGRRTFGVYLMEQVKRDDAIGDLARDWLTEWESHQTVDPWPVCGDDLLGLIEQNHGYVEEYVRRAVVAADQEWRESDNPVSMIILDRMAARLEPFCYRCLNFGWVNGTPCDHEHETEDPDGKVCSECRDDAIADLLDPQSGDPS